jgi:polysaccharide export outer membrane protein
MVRLFAIFLALAGLSACQLHEADLPAASDIPPIYRLDTGDRVAFSVATLPELAGPFDVASDGTIALPLVGAVVARARTLGEVAEEVHQRLGRDGSPSGGGAPPRVKGEVTLYRPILVLGEVNSPGGFSYSPGLRVEQAIALAGGFTGRAKTDLLVVIRVDESGRHRYRTGLGDMVYRGDIIEVQQKG